MSHHGLLVIDKPGGITSRAAVNQVQQQLPRRTRIGHAGTLDPLATGVLVLCIGVATRLTEYVQRMEKEYHTDITLGATSTTDDADGEISACSVDNIPEMSEIQDALGKFVGTIEQTPPAFSAAKVTGRRAHDLARRGETVTLKPRQVVVQTIDILGYAYPKLTLTIRCGKGTYIRSIARDLGASLGIGGYVQTLRRTRIGPFVADQAMSVSSGELNVSNHLHPVAAAVSELPTVDVSESERDKLTNGMRVPFTQKRVDLPHDTELAVYCEEKLILIGRMDNQRHLVPVKVLTY